MMYIAEGMQFRHIYTGKLRKVGEDEQKKKGLGGELLRSLSILTGMEKDVLLKLRQELAQALVVIEPLSSMFYANKVFGPSTHTQPLRQRQHNHSYARRRSYRPAGLQIKQEGKWVPVIESTSKTLLL